MKIRLTTHMIAQVAVRAKTPVSGVWYGGGRTSLTSHPNSATPAPNTTVGSKKATITFSVTEGPSARPNCW